MVQWYGYPRDTSGNAVAGPNDAVAAADGDVMSVADRFGGTSPNFEKEIPSTSAAQAYTAAFGANDLDGSAYAPVAARKPTMIRIIIQIADSAGRLTDGQNFEYVFAVK
jgi:hypothetical protein